MLLAGVKMGMPALGQGQAVFTKCEGGRAGTRQLHT